MQENVNIDEAFSWKITFRIVKTGNLNHIRGLNPYLFLEKLTSPTKKERSEVSWKKGSKMTGQNLYQKDS